MAEKRALVIDNDFFFVEFFTELLEKRHYRVYKAYDGKEGITRLNEAPVDLLFVDFVMPKIDGRRLIRYVRMKFPDSPFPIVAVSGTIIEQLDDLHRIGADYYVAKGPLDKMAEQLNEFLDEIEKGPSGQPPARKVLDPGMIFPRREAVDLLDYLQFQEAIVESVGVGVVTVDRDTRVLNANSLALEILGKSAVEVINSEITRLFSNDDAVLLASAMKKLVRNRKTGKIAFDAELDRERVKVTVSLFFLRNECGGWVLALDDDAGKNR